MSTAGINNDEMKRRAQYMNMWAAQLPAEKQNMPQSLGTYKPKGSKNNSLVPLLELSAGCFYCCCSATSV